MVWNSAQTAFCVSFFPTPSPGNCGASGRDTCVRRTNTLHGNQCSEAERLRAARAGSRRRAMPKSRWPNRNTESAGTWFAHVGECQGQLESTTHSAQRQGQDLQAARSAQDRLPAAFRAREQNAVNNNFPFSSHDNRHCLQNVGEYFDFGLGRRKVEPQRRQQNSQNFFQWASESVRRSEDGLTIYQTSFVKDKSPFSREYPKHFSEKSCTDKACSSE